MTASNVTVFLQAETTLPISKPNLNACLEPGISIVGASNLESMWNTYASVNRKDAILQYLAKVQYERIVIRTIRDGAVPRTIRSYTVLRTYIYASDTNREVGTNQPQCGSVALGFWTVP
jgi:hypothetical protein